MRLFLSLLAATAAVALSTVSAVAAPRRVTVPAHVSFAGRLETSSGPVAGPVKLRFQIYAGDEVVFSETHESVAATAGLVFASLGSVAPNDNPLDTEKVFTGDPLELEITVNGEVLSPRLPIQSVPYAFRAGVADKLGELGPGDVALAAHNHDDRYLRLGAQRTCPATSKVIAIGADGNVTCSADLNTQFTAGEGLALASTVFSIANAGVTAAKLAAVAVTTDKIANGAVNKDKLANDAVDTVKIVNGAVTEAKIANVAITNAKLANDAVTGSKIADAAVDTAALANAAVAEAKIANGAVTTAKIANGSINRDKLAGTEVSIRIRNEFCTNPGDLTRKLTCESLLCDGTPPFHFLTCAGACTANSSQNCTNPVLGFLVAP